MSDRPLPSLPLAPLSAAIGAAALGLLLGALGFQHFAGLAPCPLCLAQRGPLLAAALLALTAAAAAPLAPEAARMALGAAALVLVIGAGIALYHSGVERHWWAGPSSCAGGFALPSSAAGLSAALSGTHIIRCDSVPWSLFGLSLANYNALLSAALALLAGAALLRRSS